MVYNCAKISMQVDGLAFDPVKLPKIVFFRSYDMKARFLRNLGVEFTRHASQFIGCVSACVVEMRRCEALERTFPLGDDLTSISSQQITHMEQMLETLENLITVHFSTSEASPAERVAPRRRRAPNCRPTCVCSKLKTSYA
ncbi:unnamed protein product [Anisakis simplex]|uniref:LMWPc domain-containing protein n=1 Tax=Anisakis simplex TaxID=6269 RepID=A0A0M3JWT7_ANISI|nr:unnamed protein product [Anisakis simplex]